MGARVQPPPVCEHSKAALSAIGLLGMYLCSSGCKRIGLEGTVGSDTFCAPDKGQIKSCEPPNPTEDKNACRTDDARKICSAGVIL
eukprot:4474011-Amphidinium_carterae.1